MDFFTAKCSAGTGPKTGGMPSRAGPSPGASSTAHRYEAGRLIGSAHESCAPGAVHASLLPPTCDPKISTASSSSRLNEASVVLRRLRRIDTTTTKANLPIVNDANVGWTAEGAPLPNAGVFPGLSLVATPCWLYETIWAAAWAAGVPRARRRGRPGLRMRHAPGLPRGQRRSQCGRRRRGGRTPMIVSR